MNTSLGILQQRLQPNPLPVKARLTTYPLTLQECTPEDVSTAFQLRVCRRSLLSNQVLRQNKFQRYEDVHDALELEHVLVLLVLVLLHYLFAQW